jgi:hypothetical protein
MIETRRRRFERISTVTGCPGVMTILSHELAMTGPPAEVLCPSLFIIGQFCGKEILRNLLLSG